VHASAACSLPRPAASDSGCSDPAGVQHTPCSNSRRLLICCMCGGHTETDGLTLDLLLNTSTVIGARTNRFVCLVWPAVSSIRDRVAVAKTRASSALMDVCCGIADFLVANIIKARWCSRRHDVETRTATKRTQIVHLRAPREIKFLKRGNELQAADAGISHVGVKEDELL
jgi:hypothetical protein